MRSREHCIINLEAVVMKRRGRHWVVPSMPLPMHGKRVVICFKQSAYMAGSSTFA